MFAPGFIAPGFIAPGFNPGKRMLKKVWALAPLLGFVNPV